MWSGSDGGPHGHPGQAPGPARVSAAAELAARASQLAAMLDGSPPARSGSGSGSAAVVRGPAGAASSQVPLRQGASADPPDAGVSAPLHYDAARYRDSDADEVSDAGDGEEGAGPDGAYDDDVGSAWDGGMTGGTTLPDTVQLAPGMLDTLRQLSASTAAAAPPGVAARGVAEGRPASRLAKYAESTGSDDHAR